MTNIFKWGIIGPGRIAKKFADCVKGIPDACVQALASRSIQDLDYIKKEMYAHHAFSSYEEMLEKEELDGVYVATPHRFHFENTKLCLQNGLPVLVEKAFTTNFPEAEILIKQAKEKNLFLMEAMWTRFLPVFRQVRQILDEGKIGEVKSVVSTMGFRAKRENDDRFLNPMLAGGTILDLGVYNIAASQLIFQKPPISFSAEGFIGKTGVDEAVSVSMHYGNGTLSQFTCTFLAEPSVQIEIFGTEGKIFIHPLFYQSEKFTLIADETSREVEKPFDINGFEYEVREAQRCIRAGEIESPLMPHADTLDNMRLMDAIREHIGMKYPYE